MDVKSKMSSKSSGKLSSKMKLHTFVKGILMKALGIQFCLATLAGCSTMTNQAAKQRTVIDNSMRGAQLPAWVYGAESAWEEGDRYNFRSNYTINANQRINGCYDLAKLELTESLLSELRQDILGEVSLANEGISESMDPLITKSIRKAIVGNVKGLRIKSQVYERYLVNDVERVDCFVRGEMSRSDYTSLRQSVSRDVASVSDEVGMVVRKRQADFFRDKKSPGSESPSSHENLNKSPGFDSSNKGEGGSSSGVGSGSEPKQGAFNDRDSSSGNFQSRSGNGYHTHEITDDQGRRVY